ncbi:MAG: DUF192 domain-containing protein [Rickettsiales bacterium]|nr:DUF192 domain-containing protein [Rickettsiales bacterium]
MMRAIAILLMFVSLNAWAIDRRAPSLVYKRDSITIVPPAPFVIFSKEQQYNQTTPEAAKAEVKPITLGVSVRGEQALRQHNMHLLQTMKPEHSVMVVMRHPLDIPLMALPVRNQLDVLFVDERGMIVQIIPNLVLESLKKDYFSGREIKAILYAYGGTVQKHGIKPGYMIRHASFSPEPEVMN